MDGNSREGETSESAENSATNQRTKKMENRMPELHNVGVKIQPVIRREEDCPSADGVGSSLDDTGTSSVLPSLETQNDAKNTSRVTDDDDDDEDDTVANNNIPRMFQQRVRMAPTVEHPMQPGKLIIGPPPSYSFVMNQKAKFFKSRRSITPVNDYPLPPTYSGMQRLYLPPGETQGGGYNIQPSFSEPMWRSHSQPALCPRCGIIILTTTHSHDSVATHVAALALCLFGCWPCCLLPYCMNACKNTHHHCPICQTFLGSYSPW